MDTEIVDDTEWAAIEQALQTAQNNVKNAHNNSRNNVNTGHTNINPGPVHRNADLINTSTQNYITNTTPNYTLYTHNQRAPISSVTPAPVNQPDQCNTRQSYSPANGAQSPKYGHAVANNSPVSSPRLISTSHLLRSQFAVNNAPPINTPKSDITINGSIVSIENSISNTPIPPTNTYPLLSTTPINNRANDPINSSAQFPARPISTSPLSAGPLPVGQYEFSLVSRDRFLLQHVIFKNFQRILMPMTHPSFTRQLSSLPTALYGKSHQLSIGVTELKIDEVSGLWTFALNQHEHVLVALKKLRLQVTPLPDWIFKAFTNHAAKNSTQMVWTKLPNSLVNSLLPFQVEGIQFVVEKLGRALIGDEMGLGKTIQAIAVAAYYRDEWPLLIITPSSLRLQWAEQLERWLGDIPSQDINVVMTGKCDVRAPVNIISYDLVTKLAPKIETVNFKVVICDESHFLKSYSAKRTKSVIPILQRAKRALLLTGTPAVSRPVELFPQLSAIRPDLFPYFGSFGARYCNGHKNQFQRWDYSGNAHLKELNCLLSETVMIRRLKLQVLTQLPPKLRQKVVVYLPYLVM